MKWHFSPQLADQVENEITQRDQFNNDEVDIADTIVRETIQNSLDAAVDDPMSVHVSFKWLDKETGISPKFMEDLFHGQLEHAQAADIDTKSIDFTNPEALVIEDFGTTGLTGSITEKDSNHFSDFWRRHGKSHKTGRSRGRWGLGKLVYSTTSRLGAFFGLTVRSGENTPYLMGQTVLNLRSVKGKQYPPHAFFADLENEHSVFDRIPIPIRSKELVHEFMKNFDISRTDEPGLSIVIPFPNKEISVERMIGVAIENYFYPLITGQLVLRFNGITITQHNVRSIAKEYAADRFHQIDILFDFIEEVSKEETHELLKLRPTWLKDGRLTSDDFSDDDLEKLREKFLAGDLVSISLPLTIKRKNGEQHDSYFSLYLKRPNALEKGMDLYVRGGLTLPGEAKFRDRRALGAMIAEHEAVCAFLGDAENAAHTQWTTSTEKLRRNYINSQPIVTVIKKSLVQLYDVLADVVEETDEHALQDFFWFEEPEKSSAKKKVSKPAKPPLVPKIEPRKPNFAIHKIDGGFTVVNAEGLTEDKLPRELNIEVAYDVIKGNAFKKYSPHDFKVGKNGNVKVAAEGDIKIVEARLNKWCFEIRKLPFILRVTGFDSSRDIKIKTS